MKALQKTAPGVGNVELRDVPEPKAGPGQVVIEVGYTGICGTDLHIYLDEYKCVPPVTLGHEVAGTIVEIGDGVSGWSIGDRVTTETYFHTCGRCIHCISGDVNLCPERRSIGTHVNGGFARYLLTPAHRLHRVPDGLDLRAAAMTEPLACCIHGLLDLAHIRPGDTVVVSGPGPIGLLCLQLAKACGARTVLCGVDGDELRLETGREVGATHTINVQRQSLHDLLEGKLPEVVVEAAGAAGSLRQCLEIARRGGTVVQVGLYGRPVEVDINLVPMKQLTYVGSWAHVPWAWDRALDLMASGRVLTEPLISDVAPLEAWEDRFEALRQKRAAKVLLAPS
jgi:L-iditol 2-dehydrogenase